MTDSPSLVPTIQPTYLLTTPPLISCFTQQTNEITTKLQTSSDPRTPQAQQSAFKQVSISFKPVSPLNQRLNGGSNTPTSLIKPFTVKKQIPAGDFSLSHASPFGIGSGMLFIPKKFSTSEGSEISSTTSLRMSEQDNLVAAENRSQKSPNVLHRPQPVFNYFPQATPQFDEQFLKQLVQSTLEQGFGESIQQELTGVPSKVISSTGLNGKRKYPQQQGEPCSNPSLEKKMKIKKFENCSNLNQQMQKQLVVPSINGKQLFQDDSGEDYVDAIEIEVKDFSLNTNGSSIQDKQVILSKNDNNEEEEGVVVNKVLTCDASESTNNLIQKKSRACNCKKTKCLKLYCDCFAAGEYCGEGCNCSECSNTIANKETRDKLVEAALLSTKALKKLASKKGCNCRKSGCQKKYCQCYQDGQKCGEHCKCTGCENCSTPNDGGDSFQGQVLQLSIEGNCSNNVEGGIFASNHHSPSSSPMTNNLWNSHKNSIGTTGSGSLATFHNLDGLLSSQSSHNGCNSYAVMHQMEEEKNTIGQTTSSLSCNELQNQLVSQILASVIANSSSTEITNHPLFELVFLHAQQQQAQSSQMELQPQHFDQKLQSESVILLENLLLQAAAHAAPATCVSVGQSSRGRQL